MNEATDFEALLRRALTPIDPPTDLADRLESTLERALPKRDAKPVAA